MIHKDGDLFTSNQAVIGHGVNTVGVMGAGIAVLFRRRWPSMYQEYRRQCRAGELVAGGCMIWETGEPGFELVVNLASQDLPGANASLDWVDQSATCAALDVIERGYDTIALPRIASNIGGLHWPDVESVLARVEYETGINFEIWRYE